jgi:trans-aconitate methyltransferase
MQRSFSELFLAESYPAMSHPTAYPAVNAAIARAAGLDVKNPSQARILEIGCATGHHLLSLASRWPAAECVGMDISAKAISRARNLTTRAGLGNVRFCECSLLEFEPEGEFDFIIAHGVFSWVPDEVKIALLDFIGKRLAPEGIATVSFNVAAGWRERMAVVEKTRAIQAAGNTDEMTALSVFRRAAMGREAEIIDDMLAKGAEVLAFDDFAPVMDAWSLGAFGKLAGLSGLRMCGESSAGEMGDDAADEAAKKTFRSELLCRADAAISETPLSDFPVQKTNRSVPDFPKLNAWRRVCALEGLTVPDADLKPCRFSNPQLLVLAAMDGTMSHVRLADHAKEYAPELNFIAFLKHIAERGLLE